MKWGEGNIAMLAEEISEPFKPDGREDIPYIGLEHVEPQTLQLSAIGSSLDIQSSKQRFKEGDVLFGTMRPYFRKVIRPSFDGVCSTEFSVIRAKNAKDTAYVFYHIAQPKFIEFATTHSKGDRPRTKWELFSKFPAKIPQPEIRKRIGDILSAYDVLIENNLRRIKLLEKSARLLYKEWFVSLRFPGHEHTRIVNGVPARRSARQRDVDDQSFRHADVPEGWEKKKLGEIIELKYGKSLKEENRIEGPYPVYGSSGVVGTHEQFLVRGPGIIVGRKGNAGRVFWSQTDFFPIDTVYYIDSTQSSYYLFHNLRQQNFQSSHGAVPGLNREIAYSLPIVVPTKTLGIQFEETVTPVYEHIFKLKITNEKLRQARDLLLPRLMSGEVEV